MADAQTKMKNPRGNRDGGGYFQLGGRGGGLAASTGGASLQGLWGYPTPENFEIEMSSSQKVWGLKSPQPPGSAVPGETRNSYAMFPKFFWGGVCRWDSETITLNQIQFSRITPHPHVSGYF